MKQMVLLVSALVIGGALPAAVFSQETPSAQSEPAIAAAPAPQKKKAPGAKRVKKAPAKKAPSAPEAAAAVGKPEPAPAEGGVVAQGQQVDAATVPATAAAAPAAASVPAKQEAAPRSSCPYCFEPLLAGYNDILADLKPWIEEMELQAIAFDRKLSSIQKQIDGKDKEIENARLDPDKKAGKAAAKIFSKERKRFLNEYADALDEKNKFYKKFSKEVEKRTKGYTKIVEEKLRTTLSAASD